jgi:drug/metabolite transporter (DMT)-like permease
MMRSQIEIAVAAALAVNLPLYWIFTRRDSDGRPNPLTLGEVGVLLLVLGCYLAVPFIVRCFRRQRIVQLIPIWLWISVLGAVLVVAADYSIGITYRIERMERVAKEWLVLSIFTLPVTSLVYYSRTIVGWIRKWHEGERFNLSIVRK